MSDALLPIQAIADKLGIAEEHLDLRGKYTAKVRLDLMNDQPARGKMILVTATTPTKYGEGKTVTTIGLTQALSYIGHNTVATLREPSVGPVLGSKGGATGGGKSQVLPFELINLSFNGDFPAIAAAHNALAALIDSHIHNGNKLGIDPNSITWPRTVDMNDRSLRKIVTSLGGKANGTPREAGFVITAASEIMAILALAGSRADLRKRLSDIAIGYGFDGRLIRAGDVGGIGALMVLLNDAIMPNLVQTTENVPAFVHCGPFGNIAHGTSSVVSQQMALQLADFVVNEAGFASDLGAEKYFDIVSPATGIKPAAAVLVTTVRSIEAQGAENGQDEGLPALRRGFANLARHMENLGVYGVPFVVAINRFPNDTQEKLDYVRDFIKERGADCAFSEVFARGGEGGAELAEKVAAKANSPESEASRKAMQPLYPPSVSLEGKIETIAHEVYGAGRIYIESTARKKLKKFTELGYGALPICMAKTQSSITDDPKLLGAPTGWTLTVTDANLSAGAGFIVVIAGNMLLMPGLPEAPQAMQMDVDDDGNITGLR